MADGWFRVYRKIQDTPLWLGDIFSRGQAWIDLILLAQYHPSSFWVRGIEVKLNRGQLGWSEVSLAERWGWSRGKTRRFLSWLENDQKIVQQKNNTTSIITILNYTKYQQHSTADGQQKDSRRTADGTHTKKIQESKERKEKKIQIPAANSEDLAASADVQEVMTVFYETINPMIQFANKTQRKATSELIKKFGKEKTIAMARYAVGIQSEKYAPSVTTPVQLRDKLGQIIAYKAKHNSPNVVKI